MAEDCCNSFGGRISLEIDGVRYAPTDADIVLDVSNVEVTGGANGDGSAFYTSKPKLFGAEIVFRNPCGIVWNDKMRKCAINATIVEEDNSRTHLFTGARLTGSPRLNMSSGQVDGLRIDGPQYQAITG